jgi:hypothetical protein
VFTVLVRGHEGVIDVDCEWKLSDSDLKRVHGLLQASLTRSSNSRGSKPSRFRLLLSRCRTAESPNASYSPNRFW